MPPDAVLLVNQGSPDSPSVADVRSYLHEFLMDGRVLDLPWPLRRLIVSGFILPLRPRRVAAAYRSIWWPEGSPLVVLGERLRRRLEERLARPVGLAMRYGNPAIASALEDLARRAAAAGRPLAALRVVPLYPHAAEATTGTVTAAVRAAAARRLPATRIEVLPPFYAEPDYIEALAASASPALAGDWDHLLVSYHGLPARQLRRSDPTGRHCLRVPGCCATAVPSPAHATCYRHQVLRTTELLAARLGLGAERYSIAFQSRLGPGWLAPHTERELVRLARAGRRRLLVICPAFVADCLETLEEIGVRGRRRFRAAGGEELRLIPCLNTHPRWIEALAGWCGA